MELPSSAGIAMWWYSATWSAKRHQNFHF